jgi:IS5 family transposase
MLTKNEVLFKELIPFGGELDENNRWIRLSDLVPWDRLECAYKQHFSVQKFRVLKNSRLILGLMIGRVFEGKSDRGIVELFHENVYFQYFCGLDHFEPGGKKKIIHPSLLSKRRAQLGGPFMSKFEDEVIQVLREKGLITADKVILDATVFPSNITYPNDVKLLNTVRDWTCQTILKLKNGINLRQKIRTYREKAQGVYLNFQKTKKKTAVFIQKSRNQMLRFLKRNLTQLSEVVQAVESQVEAGRKLAGLSLNKIKSQMETGLQIYEQQLQMARTRGRRITNRVVSFCQPEVRPIVRGKEGKNVEFGPKAHVSLVDGFAILEHCQFEAFNEGVRLEESLQKHKSRFGKLPKVVIADQIYANRYNRDLLQASQIEHGFKRIGRPPTLSPEAIAEQKKQSRLRRKRQGQRNAIEATFGHLKSRFDLDKIRFTVKDGAQFQIRLGLIGWNLYRAIA